MDNLNALYRPDPYIPAMLESTAANQAIAAGDAYFFPFVVAETLEYAAIITRMRATGTEGLDTSLAVYSVGTRTGATYALTKVIANINNDARTTLNGNFAARYALPADTVINAGLYVFGVIRNTAGAVTLRWNGPNNMGHMLLVNGGTQLQSIMYSAAAGSLGSSVTFNPNAGTPSTSTGWPYAFLELAV